MRCPARKGSADWFPKPRTATRWSAWVLSGIQLLILVVVGIGICVEAARGVSDTAGTSSSSADLPVEEPEEEEQMYVNVPPQRPNQPNLSLLDHLLQPFGPLGKRINHTRHVAADIRCASPIPGSVWEGNGAVQEDPDEVPGQHSYASASPPLVSRDPVCITSSCSGRAS